MINFVYLIILALAMVIEYQAYLTRSEEDDSDATESSDSSSSLDFTQYIVTFFILIILLVVVCSVSCGVCCNFYFIFVYFKYYKYGDIIHSDPVFNTPFNKQETIPSMELSLARRTDNSDPRIHPQEKV